MKHKRKDRGQVYGLLSSWLERQRFSTSCQWVRGKRVLDVGCGVADFSTWLPKDTYYVGIEIDEEIADAGRRRHHGLEIITGAIQPGNQLLRRFIDRPFDSVVMMAVIEHMHNPSEILIELLPVLASDGTIVITTPVPGTQSLLTFGAWLGLTSKEAHHEHHALYGREELLDLLASTGFRVHLYKRFLLGLNQIVVARKIEA